MDPVQREETGPGESTATDFPFRHKRGFESLLRVSHADRVGYLHYLQRTVGNRAVQALVRSLGSPDVEPVAKNQERDVQAPVQRTLPLSGRISRDVMSVPVPANVANPTAPSSVSFNPLVKVYEDGVLTRITGIGPGGPHWSANHQILPATRQVELHTIMYGFTSSPGSRFSALAITRFNVRADGSIRDVTELRPQPTAMGNVGGNVTADREAATATRNALSSSIVVRFDASTTTAVSAGDQSSTAVSQGRTTTTTEGTTTTTGSEVNASGGGAGFRLSGSSQESQSQATADQGNSVTTTGQSTSTTTNRPGTQNTISASVTMRVDSPRREARGNSIDVPNFGVGIAALPLETAGTLQNFLSTGGPPGNQNLIRLLQHGRARIHVEGYASVTGPPEHNTDLARRRALAVQSYIQRSLSISAAAFTPIEVYGQALSDRHVGDPQNREDASWRKAVVVVEMTDD